tara:strand:+ start:1432 stop:2331 length:900 start_codon:yes stop_codon:yes gene_type:complete
MKYIGTPTRKLINQFKKSGYTFLSKSYEVVHNCLAIDLDFNYKDVPHLYNFHSGFYCYFHSISEKSVVESRFIDVFFMKRPVTLSTWEPVENENASLFNLFGFVVIISAKFENIGENQSKLITTYNVSHQNKLILKTVGPIVHHLLKRSYKKLLIEDTIIRERRGELRKNKNDFYKSYDGSYRYSETLDIEKNNVFLKEKNKKISITTKISNMVEINTGDLRGIYILKKNDLYYLHNSTCPHEGADLKNCLNDNNVIKCPWHGRLIKPLKIFNINENFSIETNEFSLTKKDENLFYETL